MIHFDLYLYCLDVVPVMVRVGNGLDWSGYPSDSASVSVPHTQRRRRRRRRSLLPAVTGEAGKTLPSRIQQATQALELPRMKVLDD
jgi:putative heme iron utilization protein